MSATSALECLREFLYDRSGQAQGDGSGFPEIDDALNKRSIVMKSALRYNELILFYRINKTMFIVDSSAPISAPLEF